MHKHKIQSVAIIDILKYFETSVVAINGQTVLTKMECDRVLYFFLSFFHVPHSHDSVEACLAGWPNAQLQGWDKCSVARHHHACLMVYVKCRCCMTSLFSCNGLHLPACLQPVLFFWHIINIFHK